MKTEELQGAAFDWAVAKAESHKIVFEKSGVTLMAGFARAIEAKLKEKNT